MQRLRPLVPLALAFMLLPVASGQEQHGHDDPFKGVTIEVLSSMTPPQLPDHTLLLLRITLEPGSEIPAHGHPGAVALTIQEGTFASSFTRGSGLVTRASAGEGEAGEEVSKDAGEVTMEAGDTLSYDGQEAAHTMRNAGNVPVVLLISALLTTDAEGFQFHEGH